MSKKFSNHNFFSITSICLLTLNFIFGMIYIKPLYYDLANQEITVMIIFGTAFLLLIILNLVLIAGLTYKYIFLISPGIIFWLVQAFGIELKGWGLSITTGLTLYTEFGFETDSGNVGLNINWFAVVAILFLLKLRRNLKDNKSIQPSAKAAAD